jgi:ferrous iron transport protein A
MHWFTRGFRHRFLPGFRFGFMPGFRHRLMPSGKQVALSQMQSGQKGRVVDILGGRWIINRLNALGIRPGRRITKISAMFMRGPVTVQIGMAQVAIGFGMARRIIVELD